MLRLCFPNSFWFFLNVFQWKSKSLHSAVKGCGNLFAFHLLVTDFLLVGCEPQAENCCVKMDSIASATFYYFNISFCWNETKLLIIGSLGRFTCKDRQWGHKGNERSIILWIAEIPELLLTSVVNPPATVLCKLITVRFQPTWTQGKASWMSLCL